MGKHLIKMLYLQQTAFEKNAITLPPPKKKSQKRKSATKNIVVFYLCSLFLYKSFDPNAGHT